MQIITTDVELIDKVLAGQQAAYAELVKRHQRFVFTLALRFTKNREDAEDVAQDCFVKAYRCLHAFQRTAKFSTWLYSIVYTTSMSFLRKKKLNTESIDDEGSILQIAETGSWYDTNAERSSRSVYVNKAIGLLPPVDAAIITLFYKGENSLDEIAKALNMETNAVKVKLHRARHRLKERLEYILKDEVKELI